MLQMMRQFELPVVGVSPNDEQPANYSSAFEVPILFIIINILQSSNHNI